ncbi:Uncharacterized conserved protein YgbK, DUF1537 family [Thermoanaerobacter uzonensis DSM 18761]|uniref:Uncharacterized conserved protein YgbK, DUF1537 family n=1 Tax=Thermoanaerobacter uzonensis DSM 18761 TaxID=1123369 RepID=A0A1M5AEE0_9THEO|nr:four-carbon acid sugar kinase family protein [Thermoanaerobacter uzonensis]SHF28589.1 Uncharacterized conserved protein YgbK, DUF1537 family [Thermoanaerobacter uzonensis DSM 18761]
MGVNVKIPTGSGKIMDKIAIIADDLTGASDTGVQFAKKGLKTSVIFDIDNLYEDSKDTDIIVIDTDSRAISPFEAYQKVKETSQKLKNIGYTQIYKKIDSTLRGNLGIEIDAIMDVFDFDFAVIAPAFPQMGRTTVEGKHFLYGKPIDQTEISKDPKSPVKESNILSLLSYQTKRKSGLITINTIRSGENDIKSKIVELLKKNVQLIVVDSETDDDLEIILDYLTTTNYRILWVGSAGLANLLANKISFFSSTIISDENLVFTENPILVVSGSISKITRQQISLLIAQPNIIGIEMNPLKILNEEENKEEIDRCYDEIIKALKRNKDVAFFVDSSPEIVQKTKEVGELLKISSEEVSHRIVDALGYISNRVINEVQLGCVILTGGDTAKAVCKYLGARGIKLIKELETGIPIGKLIGFRNLLTITKAGAFGTEETFINIIRFLKGEN